MKNNSKSYFWISYSDLMTSLFFVMLALFVLTIVLLHERSKANEIEVRKIRQIECAVKNINPDLFSYNNKYKKHVLKIDVQFEAYKFDMNSINDETKKKLFNAGNAIKDFVNKSYKEYHASYFIVVEGQTSRDQYYKDDYYNNNVLSYQRAWVLVNFWKKNGIDFDSGDLKDKCELIIAGSGCNGAMRKMPDNQYNTANQRFIINIIPKPGIIDDNDS
jgi:hypothetical protein